MSRHADGQLGRGVRGKFIAMLGMTLLITVQAGAASFLRGFVEAHDPSTIIQCKGRYYCFWTGDGILSKSSADKVLWSPGPAVFTNVPAWTTGAVPGFVKTFWAPDILFFND